MSGPDRGGAGAPREYNAAREYREIIAGITAVADALRERDRRRATDLSRELVRLEWEMFGAVERAALTRLGVELQWERAIEALWVESWMQLRRRPEADPHADPADLARFDAEVELRSAELREAVRKRRFGLPGR